MEVEAGTDEFGTGRTYEHIHYVLHIAFIEIRAAGDLQEAQIIGDIFHNVPMMMKMHRSVSTIERELFEKALRHGVEKRVYAWLRSAERNLPETHAEITDRIPDKQVLKND
jgi:hypothetical protein